MTASYPTTVKSFTAPVDGVDDVLADFTVQMQEEIAAIETALGASLGNVIPNGGWVPFATTWTYASASTFTVAGDQRTTFKKGKRVRWVQSAATKYGVVSIDSTYSSPNTTVTILVNTDYTIANAAISSPYTSDLSEPSGWPGMFSYTPTVTAGSGTLTSYTVNTAKFSFTAGLARVFFSITITDKGTGAGALKISIPWAIGAAGWGSGRENGLTGKQLQVFGINAETLFYVFDYAGLTIIDTNAVVVGGIVTGT